MRKFLLILAFAIGITASAYDGVSKLFLEENSGLFAPLQLSMRYELLNNYGRADASEVLNSLRTTESRILKLENDYMVIATSAGRTVEMKLLPKSKKDTVIAVIETVATPYKDSRLAFYDTKWKRLDASQFIKKMPDIDDFIRTNAPKTLRDDLLSNMSFAMIEMTFQGNLMVATCNLKDFYLGQDFKKMEPYLTGRIVYGIDKSKFKKQ